ncbi:MAG: 30S ribosomal protein S27ae [Candidatus Sigynarchaeota archaeon]
MGKKEAEQKAAAEAPAAAPAKGKAPAGKGAKPAAAAPAKKKVKGVPKKIYAVQGNKLTRTKTECPKCGTGYFMAVHYNRRTCGKCSYTQFTDKDGNVRGFGGAPMGGPAGAMRQSRRLGRQTQAGGGGPGPAGEE